MVTLLLTQSLIFANEKKAGVESQGVIGIYHCIKDLDGLRSSSIASEKSVPEVSAGYISISRNGNSSHTLARRCFMLLGEEIDDGNNSDRLRLKIIDSAGYGVIRDGDEMGWVTGEGWLYNPEERDQFAVSCIKITYDYDNTIDDGRKNKGLVAHRKGIRNVWYEIVSYMQGRGATDVRSRVVLGNNCCVASYGSIRHVEDLERFGGVRAPEIIGIMTREPILVLDKEAIKNINKSDFNFLGRGISFDAKDSSDSLSGGLVYVKRKLFSSDDEDDHKEL